MIFRDFEQNIVKVINESGMSIDAVYSVMKSLMSEIEQKYTEFCRQEDIERAEMAKKELESNQTDEESSSDAEKTAAANINEEGAK